MLGIAVLSRNDVVPFLVHDCSSKSMAKEGGCKSEAFSLAKTENLFEVFKSFELLLVVSCETFFGNFSVVLRNNSDFLIKSSDHF